MPIIKLKDISLYYELQGRGETLVLIGGFGNDHQVWQEVADTFSKNYQLLLLDNRGSGQSEVPSGSYSIDLMADDVAQLCANLNINHAHFIGNSMGGFIVQNLAYRYPKLVKTATISNSSTSIHSGFEVFMQAQLNSLKAGIPLKILVQAACNWAFSYHYLSRPGMLDKLIQKNLEAPHPFTIKGYEGQYAAVAKFDSKGWVKHLTMPVLVLGADQDLIFLESRVRSLVEQIPHAEYYRFVNCGHLPQIEYPEKFAALIHNFIERNPFS